MTGIVETPIWEPEIYQLEQDDVVLGGPDGIDNLQGKQLANRTAYLKQQIEQAGTDLAAHEAAADPHPQYVTNPELTAAINALIASAPGALDTLNELATAMGNDPNFAATITAALATKLTQDQGDARYALLTALASYALKGVNSDITALNAVTSGSVFRKNVLINGNFDIWQRGVSNSVVSGSAPYVADRWFHDNFVSGVATYSRQAFALGQTAVPGEPSYYLNWTVTSALGLSADLRQRIESVRTFAGKTVTISFYAKSDAARNMNLNLDQIFGTGGSPSVTVTTAVGAAALTTDWQKFAFTVALPSLVGKTLGANGDDCLQLRFFTSTATQSVSIAQVQLEEGSVATAFDWRPPSHELDLCQRYFEKSYELNTAPGSVTSTGTVAYRKGNDTEGIHRMTVFFKARKRVMPTVTAYSSSGASGKVNINGTDYSVTYSNPSQYACEVEVNNAVANSSLMAFAYTADAEL